MRSVRSGTFCATDFGRLLPKRAPVADGNVKRFPGITPASRMRSRLAPRRISFFAMHSANSRSSGLTTDRALNGRGCDRRLIGRRRFHKHRKGSVRRVSVEIPPADDVNRPTRSDPKTISQAARTDAKTSPYRLHEGVSNSAVSAPPLKSRFIKGLIRHARRALRFLIEIDPQNLGDLSRARKTALARGLS